MGICQALGFSVEKGGSHRGFGTCNAIMRFGLDYIELLAVENEEVARTATPGSLAIVNYLEQREWGLLGFMLAGAELDACCERLNKLGIETPAPWGMSRVRPDGRELAWKLLTPGGGSWRKPWPTVIEWATPDEERVEWDGIGSHPNGALALSQIQIAARSSARSVAVFEQGFGLQADQPQTLTALNAEVSRIDLDRGSVEIIVPLNEGDSEVNQVIRTQAEGVYNAMISVANIEQTAEWFARHGLAVTEISEYSLSINTGGLLDGLVFSGPEA